MDYSRSFRRTLGLFFCLIALCLMSLAAYVRQPQVEKDVVYGTINGTKLLLDVYRPQGFTGKRPGVVLVHGGGWVAGDKGYYAPVGNLLASHGYVAFSVNYRLAPVFHYPAQVDDVQRAVRWIRAHAADYDLDPDRLGALGDSAGGYLVAMLGTRDTRDNSDKDLAGYSSRVQCVVDLYGPTDFTVPTTSPGVTAQGLQFLKAFFGKMPEEAPALYREGSPIISVNKQSAPFLIFHGTADPLVPVDQSERLYKALKAAGVETALILLYDQSHGFGGPLAPGLVAAAAGDFLNHYLKP